MTVIDELRPGTIWQRDAHTTAVLVEVRGSRVYLSGFPRPLPLGNFLARWRRLR